MSKLTPVERSVYLWELWESAASLRGVNLDAFVRTLEFAAERDTKLMVERWYRDNVNTGVAACRTITGGQWP